MRAFTQFRGKTAVVTGGASGMGKGIAQSLIAEGMRVFIADIEEKALHSTAAEIGATGIRTDVRDFESGQALARRIRELAGSVHADYVRLRFKAQLVA
jgi:NAD(P)-dependent dehydrogenase (short-subunit alcohol dehydrogenase family)